MTTFAPTFWFAIMPLMLLGGALVGVGAFKGTCDGRVGESFSKTRPYRAWAISGFVIFGLGVMAMAVWVVTLPA